jgi:hypothetical protein
MDATVPSRGLVVRPASGVRATVGLARFAALPPPGTGLALGGPAWLHPPPDGATVPWRARVAAGAPVSVC